MYATDIATSPVSILEMATVQCWLQEDDATRRKTSLPTEEWAVDLSTKCDAAFGLKRCIKYFPLTFP